MYLGQATSNQQVATRESPLRQQIASVLDGFADGQKEGERILAKTVRGSYGEPPVNELKRLIAEYEQPADDNEDPAYVAAKLAGLKAALANADEQED